MAAEPTTEEIQRRVDDLDEHQFQLSANWAATQLHHGGNAYVELTPGDMTRYPIGILQWHNINNGRLLPGFQHRWFVATTYGPMYEWGGAAEVHWSYVLDKWITRPGYTGKYAAMIFTRFLNTLSPLIHQEVTDER